MNRARTRLVVRSSPSPAVQQTPGASFPFSGLILFAMHIRSKYIRRKQLKKTKKTHHAPDCCSQHVHSSDAGDYHGVMGGIRLFGILCGSDLWICVLCCRGQQTSLVGGALLGSGSE